MRRSLARRLTARCPRRRMDDSGYESQYGDTADFVEFSGDLRKILKKVETEVEHWLSQDAVEALNEAIKAFVGDICEASLAALDADKSRKVLSPFHIVQGLESKGFGAIVREMQLNHPDLLQGKTRKRKKSEGGMSEQQLVELQQMLFAQAKAKQSL